ncbi:hypothetical protein D9V96_016885 [Zobellia laminariae]|uniref:hypothetical protein n=1 Tax=Zobellia laminariae TaxID=248906 RepID=UPI0012D88960|nr:hypothetical protein [Zobellia laminariae]
MTEKKSTIEESVLKWLNSEGYPLEFETARIFSMNKFSTRQGSYVSDFKTGLPKELDVVADVTKMSDGTMLRISHLVECKWTEDKPWVIFTDRSARIAESASIAQSIATDTMSTILWCLAADKDIKDLNMFSVPDRPGFNGRQAFNKSSDLIYSTLQSIISASFSKTKYYENDKTEKNPFKLAVFVRPLIVIKGRLFESFYNYEKKEVEIEEKKSTRLYWKGAEAWNLHSTVDIVTIDHLETYAKNLKKETDSLIEKMDVTLKNIKKSISTNSLEPLGELKAARGIIGLPPLLHPAVKNKK